jgi:hypothetical protein
MFQMYADGYGQKTIAWTLNANAAQRELLKRYFGGKQPRPPRADKPSGAKDWSPHTIHDMLRNPRYLGFNGYGATKRKYIGGTKRIISIMKMASPRRTAAKPAIKFVRKIYLKGFRRRIIGLHAFIERRAIEEQC